MRYVVHNHFPARVLDSYQEFPVALQQAKSIDPLHYLEGLSKLTFARDNDKWNADYNFDTDTITVRDKFHKKTFMDKVQTLLHEGGHRGQVRDPKTFDAFQKAGLCTEKNFLAMANKVHQDDFKKNGIGDAQLADECFAESYARFALGMDMPRDIKAFWTRRASR